MVALDQKTGDIKHLDIFQDVLPTHLKDLKDAPLSNKTIGDMAGSTSVSRWCSSLYIIRSVSEHDHFYIC